LFFHGRSPLRIRFGLAPRRRIAGRGRIGACFSCFGLFAETRQTVGGSKFLAPGAQQQAAQQNAGKKGSELAELLRKHVADYKEFFASPQALWLELRT
jgi:hypothetical protein